MSAALVLIVRLFLIYFVVRVAMNLFSGRKGVSAFPSNSTSSDDVKRFDSRGQKIKDADFEEIK